MRVMASVSVIPKAIRESNRSRLRVLRQATG